ncbi:adenylate kinase 7-like [Acyrthosiphon pisum]|uniref:Uncharacterized protein n=1 Tax=Acyrthosiphon pisum TaxID=7029 RepID=A0A8R1X0X3_ACYPI|nr:adenylate kinase 7-like [Acyrthosiphon pisum]|eukprot:XP_008178877.1 PREDICTED: adenylate kinase 7-like [Acyrthosiphon pisum]
MLMQCGVTIFDITNDSEIELEEARFSFNYIYNELINYSDEEIIRSKEKGICRKFILISTAMTWVKETCKNHIYSENEEVNTSFTEKGVLERLPIAKYQIIFEFEKLLLKSNSSKIKDIFQTYVFGTGIIYGHEENALHYVFTNAWHNPKEMYISMLNRTVPVFHIDELAKLVFIVSKNYSVKNNYILAVEQESYGFNNIIKSMCDELCSSNLVLKEDSFITNQYKFNSFTWDLICSDLNIDSMLDIIVPDYKILQTSIISNMKKLTLDFVEANNLYSLKIIVSGQPTHMSSNIAKRLAKYYKVQLIDIPNLINNCFTSLKNDRIELELKMNDLYIKRTNIKHALVKLIAQFDEWLEHINEQLNLDNSSFNEQNNNEMIDDTKQNSEIINNNTQISENEILTDSSENNIQKCCEDTCSAINEKSKICFNFKNLEQDMTSISNSFKSESSDIHYEQEVPITGSNMNEKNITESIIVHRLNVPLELADETISHNFQYKFYTDTIISLIGRNPFKDIRYETNDNQKSKKTRKLQRISNKLNMMNEQWKQDINKTLKQEKKQEYRNSVKIHNYISKNILPKLLKEVSPVNNRDSHFPEKTLNKTKLCNTQTDENITRSILITKST